MEKIRKSKRGARSKFDPAFKRKAVLDFHYGTGTKAATARKYGISHTTLDDWIVWYEQDQEQLLTLGVMDAEQAGNSKSDAAASDQTDDWAKDTGKDAGTPSATAQDVKALTEELRQTKVKLACLETLIDLTERDLGIDIRKKAGTKSSEE